MVPCPFKWVIFPLQSEEALGFPDVAVDETGVGEDVVTTLVLPEWPSFNTPFTDGNFAGLPR
jgi:hypothetical protein